MNNRQYEAGELAEARAGGIDLQGVDTILDMVRQELIRATVLHGPMASAHEAYSVIKEELEEFWDDVKRDAINDAHKEAIQIAAMCVRFVYDVAPGNLEPKPGPLTRNEIARLRALLANSSF